METREIKNYSEKEVNAKFAELGFDTDKIKQFNTRASQAPKEGVFADIDSDEYEGNKYPILIVVNDSGEKIGSVAVNSIRQRIVDAENLEPMEITTVNPDYPERRFRLKEMELNDVARGKSLAEVVSACVGKKYTSSNPLETVYALKFQETAQGKPKMKNGKRLVDFPNTAAEAKKRITKKVCFKLESLEKN